MADRTVEKKKKDTVIVLSMPTTHDVHSPIKKQFGADVSIGVLSGVSLVELSDDGILRLANDMKEGINKILERHPDLNEVDLIITGLPIANIIAYRILQGKGISVNFLVYDTRKRRYYQVNGGRLEDIVKSIGWGG